MEVKSSISKTQTLKLIWYSGEMMSDESIEITVGTNVNVLNSEGKQGGFKLSMFFQEADSSVYALAPAYVKEIFDQGDLTIAFGDIQISQKVIAFPVNRFSSFFCLIKLNERVFFKRDHSAQIGSPPTVFEEYDSLYVVNSDVKYRDVSFVALKSKTTDEMSHSELIGSVLQGNGGPNAIISMYSLKRKTFYAIPACSISNEEFANLELSLEIHSNVQTLSDHVSQDVKVVEESLISNPTKFADIFEAVGQGLKIAQALFANANGEPKVEERADGKQ